MKSSMITVDYTEQFVETSILHPTDIIVGAIILILSVTLNTISKIIHAYEENTISFSTSNPSLSSLNVISPFKSHRMLINDNRFGRNKTLNLHFLHEGNADNRDTILCLHGVPFSSHSFHRIIPYFVKQGYSVVAPDLIGFGKSEKYIDWKAYDLELHKSTILQLLHHINQKNENKSITLVGHNWGFLLGATLMKDHPNLFSKIVILNTNNLPDGEVDLGRFKSMTSFTKYLIIDAFFLLFRSSILLLGKYLPPKLLFYALGNGVYKKDEIETFDAPFQRIHQDRGGMVSFPLMVPVFASDRYASEFKATRQFLGNHWNASKTLIIFSDKTSLPWIFGDGDFIVGNRRSFFKHLMPNATEAPLITNAGHIVMYDQPQRVADLVNDFLKKS